MNVRLSADLPQRDLPQLTNNCLYKVTIGSEAARTYHTRGCDSETALEIIRGHISRAQRFPRMYNTDDSIIVYELPKNNTYAGESVKEMLPTLPIGYIVFDLGWFWPE